MVKGRKPKSKVVVPTVVIKKTLVEQIVEKFVDIKANLIKEWGLNRK